MSKLVTIKTFSNIGDLSIVKGRLETEGIPCYVKDEFSVSTLPAGETILGGIKLQVMDEDVARANELLHEYGNDSQPKLLDARNTRADRYRMVIIYLALALTLISVIIRWLRGIS
jgi:Putative prokaryotic signal transducing protein